MDFDKPFDKVAYDELIAKAKDVIELTVVCQGCGCLFRFDNVEVEICEVPKQENGVSYITSDFWCKECMQKVN